MNKISSVLRRAGHVSTVITGGQDTVGLRVPNHPVALELLREFGTGIAAPSANRFGRLSPTSAIHVRNEMGNSIDYILDGGTCHVGIESAIIDLTSEKPRLLRPGTLPVEELEATIKKNIVYFGKTYIRAPGMHTSHYAPKTPLSMASVEHLEFCIHQALERDKVVGVLSMTRLTLPDKCFYKTIPMNPELWARQLYAMLREFDASNLDCILIETPPRAPGWEAVHDRLSRAASSTCKPRTSLL